MRKFLIYSEREKKNKTPPPSQTFPLLRPACPWRQIYLAYSIFEIQINNMYNIFLGISVFAAKLGDINPVIWYVW